MTGIVNYYHDYVSLLLLKRYIFLEQSQVICRYIIHMIIDSLSVLGTHTVSGRLLLSDVSSDRRKLCQTRN